MAAVLTRKLKPLLLSSTKTLPSLLRFFSSQAIPSCRTSSSHLMWSSEVNSFGKLSILGGIESVDLHVKPSKSAWEGEHEQVTAYLVSEDAQRVIDGGLQDILECVVFPDSCEPKYSIVKININAGNCVGKCCRPSLLGASKILVEIPQFFNLYIHWSASSNLTVEKLEGDVHVQTIGNCVLSHLKSPSITVNSTHGSIDGKSSLIGDSVLTTHRGGDINVDKLQGINNKIDCAGGQLRIKSLYGEKTVLNTDSGEIHVGDAHGNVSASSSSGDVTVDSICGQLTAVLSCGDLDAKLTAGGNIDATCSNGNATIKIDDNLRCDFDLRAKTMDISRDINIPGKRLVNQELVSLRGQCEGHGAEQRVCVNCPKGNVKLLRESWFVLPDM